MVKERGRKGNWTGSGMLSLKRMEAATCRFNLFYGGEGDNVLEFMSF